VSCALLHCTVSALCCILQHCTELRCIRLYCTVLRSIIEPLASRCAKFRFKPLMGDVINERINHICQAEGLSLDPAVRGYYTNTSVEAVQYSTVL